MEQTVSMGTILLCVGAYVAYKIAKAVGWKIALVALVGAAALFGYSSWGQDIVNGVDSGASTTARVTSNLPGR